MNEFYLDNMLLGMKPFSMLHRFGVNGKIAGNLGALQEIKNSAVILYGPKGCAFHYRYSTRMRNAPFYELESADLKNEDVIFGGGEKLRELVLLIDKTRKPDAIFIVPTVVSDVVNDDVQALAAELDEKTAAQVIAVKSQAFSHMDKTHASKMLKEKANQKGGARYSGSVVYPGCGYVEVMDALVEQVMQKQRIEPLSVNIESFIWGYDGARKLERMQAMFAAMGVRVNCFLPAADINSLRQAPKAALNIVRRKKWALTMREKFGTDFIHVADMHEWHGLQGIKDFYLAAAQKLGVQTEARVVLAAEEAKIMPRYKKLRAVFSAHRFGLISGSFSGLPELIEGYHKDYGMPLKHICLILNPSFQAEAGIDGDTLEKMRRKIFDVMAGVGCAARFTINPSAEELRAIAGECDYLLCGSNPRYSSLGKPVIPLFLDRPVFDFASFIEIMEEMAAKLRNKTAADSLLLNRAEYDPVFFPLLADDANSRASREMYSRMWRLRKK